MDRSLKFSQKSGDRFWWHKLSNSDFVPPLYAFLSDAEWQVMEDWFEETDTNVMVGESNIPFLSVLQGFIMGSVITNIVELGTFVGYSSLLIGFMLKRMGLKNKFFTVDIDKLAVSFAQKHVEKAGLSDYVRTNLGDSSDSRFVELAKAHFGGEDPHLIILDSSHQKEHTLQELELWFEALIPGGLIFLHDTSDLACTFDATGKGGVKAAFDEWVENRPNARYINIQNVRLNTPSQVYRDSCGLGIIQKDDS